jgi:hypothetical protein
MEDVVALGTRGRTWQCGRKVAAAPLSRSAPPGRCEREDAVARAQSSRLWDLWPLLRDAQEAKVEGEREALILFFGSGLYPRERVLYIFGCTV